jgi:hypothetical protein
MPGGLVEVTGEVAGGTELKVALGTPVLGVVLRVLHYHPRVHGSAFLWW